MGWRENKAMYVMGVPPVVGKKIARYAFGAWFERFSPNPSEGTYDIYVYADVDDEVIAYFKSFWNQGWRVFKSNKSKP